MTLKLIASLFGISTRTLRRRIRERQGNGEWVDPYEVSDISEEELKNQICNILETSTELGQEMVRCV